MRALAFALVLSCTGCALLARDHACYPYLDHRLHGNIPANVLHDLARERGTKRHVGPYHAPSGYYLRPRARGDAASSGRDDLARYEVAPCPGTITNVSHQPPAASSP